MNIQDNDSALNRLTNVLFVTCNEQTNNYDEDKNNE